MSMVFNTVEQMESYHMDLLAIYRKPSAWSYDFAWFSLQDWTDCEPGRVDIFDQRVGNFI
jgi:hypothetical protein